MRSRPERRPPAIAALAVTVALAAVGAACRGDAEGRDIQPPALELLASGPAQATTDTFEVWVCHVPGTTTDPIYVAGGARLDLTPGDVARRLQASVPEYFAALSAGAYRPVFVAGGDVAIAADDDHQACIDGALDRSSEAADAVYVVADAEHDGDQPGGLAQAGTGCTCPARTSRRMVYVGASDFDPSWGPIPAVDLTEHEIGHTLGLPHSTDDATPDAAHEHAYTSAIDVMSNSAAPRDTDPARRHGPATIAANLLALGWMPTSAAAVVPAAGAAVSLSPSVLGKVAVAVVALDAFRLLTVELLVPAGYDDHLPAAGVAVHLVDQSPAACGHTDGTPCTGLDRRQVVLGSAAPHTDLLTTGEVLEVEGWRIEVTAVATDGGSATVALRPTHR
jgi:hypothetical protein